MDVLDCDTENKEEKYKEESCLKSKYFWRQLLICSGVWIGCFHLGLSLGSPTVFIPQIRAEANSTEAVTETMASWIPSIIMYSGLPWSFILPFAMKVFGRKYTFTFVCICNFVSYTTMYFSTTVIHIVISEIIAGINAGAHFNVYVIIIAEYTSAKYRGFFLTAKVAPFSCGILIANTIGTFYHWKNIAIVGMAGSIYTIIISFLYPESPYWLNTKHKFGNCSKVHRWLKGSNKKSEKALENLINHQMNIDKRSKPINFVSKDFLLNVVLNKKFYKPLALCILVSCSYFFLGKLVFNVYIIDIIRKITKDREISAYTTMLILDVFTIPSLYIGCVLARLFPRRKLFITASFVAILILFSMSLYKYMIKLNFLPENNYVPLTLLVCYSISLAVGPAILCQTIIGELVSLEYRALFSCCIDVSQKLIMGTLIKVGPYIFKYCGTEGAFLFFAISSGIFLVLFYKYLPETKDKTLQEIAELVQGSKETHIFREQSDCLATKQNYTD